MKSLSNNSRYFIIVVGVGILILLVVGFNNRITTLRRLEDEAEQVSEEVQILESTQAFLETQIAYATSEAAVEEWAYQEARMIREGDYLVAPISPSVSTPEPQQIFIPTPQSLENWQVWKALFFDQSLP
jgi:cell division protein FtsB